MDNSPSDIPHRCKPRRRYAAAEMPDSAEGTRTRCGAAASIQRLSTPYCCLSCFFAERPVLFRPVLVSACLLLAGCSSGKNFSGKTGFLFWGTLLVTGILAFCLLSFRLKAEGVSVGVLPGFLSGWLKRAQQRVSFSGAEELSFSLEPIQADEIFVQACERSADILLSPAPLDNIGGEKADRSFEMPAPSSTVSAFSEELEASFSRSSARGVLPLRGSCLHVDASRLVIRTISPLEDESWQFWAGRPVHARLTFNRGYGVHSEKLVFSFFCRIRGGDLRNYETLLSLSRPERVERVQHRLFPRTVPEEEDVALGFWPWPVLASLPPEAPAGKPFLVWGYPSRNEGNARLENLSASGVGIAVRREIAAAAPQSGVLLLSLRQRMRSPLTLWLACSLRHVTGHADGVRRSHAVLGYALEAWSPWGQGSNFRKELAWRPVAADGEVPPLLRWVLRDMAAQRRISPRFFNLQTPGASLGR